MSRFGNKPFVFSAAMALAVAGAVFSETRPAETKGTFERIKVHGKSLEGNLEGDSPDRDVSIYLPPGYKTSNRRYPVLYLLHGYTNTDDGWFGPNLKSGFLSSNISVPQIADKAIAAGAREMIIVLPNAYTVYQGSMYSNSITTGNWEEYITHDLVNYVDTHYRTIARPESRGLAGHSMGGYGVIRLAMKYPGIYSSIYVMSACCLNATLVNPQSKAFVEAEAVRSQADAAKLSRGPVTMLAEGAAWSPNPKNPPLFFDLPVKDGHVQPQIAAKWAANAPLAMIDQYIPNLRKLHAIAMDVGDKDGLMRSNQELSGVLTSYGIEHTIEIYDGDHTNHVPLRLEKNVLPFFSGNLNFSEKGKHSN